MRNGMVWSPQSYNVYFIFLVSFQLLLSPKEKMLFFF